MHAARKPWGLFRAGERGEDKYCLSVVRGIIKLEAVSKTDPLVLGLSGAKEIVVW